MSQAENEATEARARLAARGMRRFAETFPETAVAAMRAAAAMARRLPDSGEPAVEPASVFRPDDIAAAGARDD